MINRRKNTCWAVAALALSTAACANGEVVQLGSVHVKTQAISRGLGGTIQIEAQDVPNNPQLIGTKVVIAPGALAEDTMITIGFDPVDLPDADSDAIGAPVIELGPSGTQFSIPAELHLPYGSHFDEDLARVVVREADGLTQVLLPEALTFDAATDLVKLTTQHFTRFQGRRARHACAHVTGCASNQCRRGRCVPDCTDPASCGPAPALANWTCEDSTVGGPTGRCIRQDDRCGWEIRWCPRSCSDGECGPQPGMPTYQCPDGSTGGPTGRCLRQGSGSCGWEIRECPDCRATQTATASCPEGWSCDQSTGRCTPVSGAACGPNTCPRGQFCCDATCGICSSSPDFCPQISCTRCDNTTVCPDGQRCDPASGGCAPITCDPGDCGPRPGTPSWICQDGTAGGFTGRCIPELGVCAWEVIWCARACNDAECGPPPASPVACTNICTRTSTGACEWSTCTEPCDANECGPRPGMPNTVCADGTIAGPTDRCVRDPATNRCSWEFESCPT